MAGRRGDGVLPSGAPGGQPAAESPTASSPSVPSLVRLPFLPSPPPPTPQAGVPPGRAGLLPVLLGAQPPWPWPARLPGGLPGSWPRGREAQARGGSVGAMSPGPGAPTRRLLLPWAALSPPGAPAGLRGGAAAGGGARPLRGALHRHVRHPGHHQQQRAGHRLQSGLRHRRQRRHGGRTPGPGRPRTCAGDGHTSREGGCPGEAAVVGAGLARPWLCPRADPSHPVCGPPTPFPCGLSTPVPGSSGVSG